MNQLNCAKGCGISAGLVVSLYSLVILFEVFGAQVMPECSKVGIGNELAGSTVQFCIATVFDKFAVQWLSGGIEFLATGSADGIQVAQNQAGNDTNELLRDLGKCVSKVERRAHFIEILLCLWTGFGVSQIVPGLWRDFKKRKVA